MSSAVTLAQPISAAAIATNPVPVHRSMTWRPAITPVRRIVSTSRWESCCGWYTGSATSESPGAGYVIVTESLSAFAVAVTALPF
ncbi:hypothetical protein Mkiyose1665_35370 [Mycobacterium kiyosense]|uniref:Uncharacterized protein n=1 Tax=Mycobacterium kiyosense TaxID=2871094 RepID=A0A9P3UYL5_9MYCO|nr:hypothetical protein MKCMC460_57910 [Mycobacterium sp. 20KCMC460]GLB91037.1 hypothetical protein SRL2020130_38540 [Mycobacterium kiyosense]GLB96963.1 hypothetical protein SRL2020226_37390 [Mycobacterium kiyosense]GLC09126.1 hypothetical protein SRL2020411_37720 [Mycobacterium kiyosense]GLC15228.1 hypothetical protein SRL2020448_38310 [Mycobacterium kiyosense]